MVPTRRSALARALVIGALAASISACAPVFVPGAPTDGLRPSPTEAVRPDPTRPDPTRPDPSRPVTGAALPAQGSILQFEVTPDNIRPSSTLVFRTRFAQAGYLTVSAMAPNGRIDVLLRNVPVTPGLLQLVPPVGASPSERVQASAPFGTWIVRAQFSQVRTEARYQNVQGYDAWTVAVANDLRGAANASVFETSYEVEQR